MAEVTSHSLQFDADACQAREVLDRVADKWSLYVVATLSEDEYRFTEIKRSIDGISQRMLTVTLRGLERDGIVTRTIYSAMPPNIAYRLTDLGKTLWEATAPLVAWAMEHLSKIDVARTRYDEIRAAEEKNAISAQSRHPSSVL
ncbi:MAG TPA: helix-turn-helix domain-containing protein [Acidimicrobiales bacterium]|jgi:DNA-binding HxlR family transcriptional regulator